jgi:ABC-type microcin C transport system permease subunit YejB
VLAFGAFFVGQALLTSPAPHASLSQPGVLRAVIGAGLMIPVLGLFALGIGTIVRHTAGAITTYVAGLLVLPLIVQALPSSVGNPIMKFLPFRISDIMTTVGPVHRASAFHPWVGFAILCGYALIALVLGGILMVRRDA